MTGTRYNGVRPTRRTVLQTGSAFLVAASIAGCDTFSTDPGKPADKPAGTTGSKAGAAKEAPMLAALVKAGKLPSLEKRLPKDPLVIKPVEQSGEYGGTWHTATLGPSDTAWPYRTTAYDGILRWDLDFTKTLPNVATSVEPNEDGSEWTIKLREGMRWSDGEPFTADDLLFGVEDVYKNTEITPTTPSWLVADNKPATAKKVDDQTLVLTYPAPTGLLAERFATSDASTWPLLPKHYLKQFHKKYNPDVDTLVKEHNASDWARLFQQMGTQVQGAASGAEWLNPDLPVLNAWHLTQPYGKGTELVVERNPYYWKVDSEGRQLPYIDKVSFAVITDPQVMLLKATNGEFDYHSRHFTIPQNKPVLARNRDKGGYDFTTENPSSMNQMMVALNLAHEDPVMRKIFQNKDFRIGLSYAINRQEIIDAAFQRQGSPWQAAPKKQSDFYLEGLGEQYTEHDVAKANQFLDRAGYSNKDSGGHRLRPDGKPIQFQIELATGLSPTWPDAVDMIKGYWQKVGIQIQAKAEERSLFYNRKADGKCDCAIWGGDGGLHDAILDPRWYFPFSQESNYADPWANWYNDDHAYRVEKPPAAARKQMTLYDKLEATADAASRKDLFMQILQIAKEQFWVIGIALPGPGYGIVKKTFHNVPKNQPSSWQYPNPGPSQTCQYFTTAT